jgi:hypothetical protein
MLNKFLNLIVIISLFIVISRNYGQSKNNNASTSDADFVSSNLPLVVIDTDGKAIVDNVKISAKMKIIYNNPPQRNYITDPGNIYNGNMGIEIHGSYSATFPQKSYGFETRDSLGNNLNVSLLNMPVENDWILLGSYNDKVFIRNSLAFDLFKKMGHYQMNTRLCEVVVNNVYQGIYVLTEKLKRDKDRVDISKLTSADTSGNALTGGYIIKIDYEDGTGKDGWRGNYPAIGRTSSRPYYIYSYPKPSEIVDKQKFYIQSFINKIDSILRSPVWKDPVEGYLKYLNIQAFIDYFIVGEVSRNVDAYKKSAFFYKDRDDKDGRLQPGPVWDFDWAWKNMSECMSDGIDGSGWTYLISSVCRTWPVPPGWAEKLLEDEIFANELHSRYTQLRKTILSGEYFNHYIDSISTLVSEAQVRHYQKWPILGINVGSPEIDEQPKTFEGEITKFKNWISTRMNWLDANMPGKDINTNPDTTEISIINASFEEPGTDKIKGWDGICADPSWSGLQYDIPGWNGDAPAFDSGVEQNQGATDGLWTAFLMGSDTSVYQITNYIIQTGDKFDLKVDAKSTWEADLLAISLFYPDVSNAKIPLVSKKIDITNEMSEYTISLNSEDFPASINHKLGIMFDNVSSASQSWLGLDNIRLYKYRTNTGVGIQTNRMDFSLAQNFPNPFNPVTTIHYTLKNNSIVSLKVYDLVGREIAVLINDERKTLGNHTVSFNAKNLSSGVYFYQLRAEGFMVTRKMMLVK